MNTDNATNAGCSNYIHRTSPNHRSFSTILFNDLMTGSPINIPLDLYLSLIKDREAWILLANLSVTYTYPSWKMVKHFALSHSSFGPTSLMAILTRAIACHKRWWECYLSVDASCKTHGVLTPCACSNHTDRAWHACWTSWPAPISVLCMSVDFVSYTVAWGFMLSHILITASHVHATAPCSARALAQAPPTMATFL